MEARKLQRREIMAMEFLFGKVEMSNFVVFTANGLILTNIIQKSSMKSKQQQLDRTREPSKHLFKDRREHVASSVND